ncbi:MAG: ADP-forming succinate--CoA ligase subunit beta [Gammaproteobacteria bacterium]|nr:ADP-forming succinate--CoA ligase subunit beta [Gammaproteobacteria bacterium]NIR97789.1 ADP-forming succinate--CoA ligase subunit beta [Gammaproteobacteria bacterium]NIT63489.1 ADP-forming succinate--CoA ligase subunit beta [Gammaproteobacteria bacterium]NIV20436.1 ADP-forming succinate--CoA ligase subunit beta [Gammaproteobacteria bacterium]NIX11018.1 ADP-forming succinate--CoA ligase subunit beta [Gammaproteobacteria bacterium]
MHLHEFQAKELFAQYGIPVPPGRAARTVREVGDAARALGGGRWVVKAQVHAGGRGKGGGVRVVGGLEELESAADELLGSRLVTSQTGPEGLPVDALLVEQASDIARELYVGALVDRERERLVLMASAAGGMDIEEVAATQPEQILTAAVDPAAALQPYQCRRLAFGLGLEGAQIGAFTRILLALHRLFVERDASLVEINPLIVTGRGELCALDAKINVDDNALFRQEALAELRDPSQEDATEHAAAQHGLNYVTLDGNIGCMVNGAGLAMATMDLIKLHGGEPANFLDVGGGTTAEKVAEAFKLILADPKVEAILVNIFGGIVRCDLIAEGIVGAAREAGIDVPVVVRLEGTNVERGREILDASGLKLTAARDLTEAAKSVVAAA